MKFGFSRKFVLFCLLSFICSFMAFASSAVVVSFVGKVEVNRNNVREMFKSQQSPAK